MDFKNLTELFNRLNMSCNYIVLRNWDDVFHTSIYSNGHNDIDILCDDLPGFVELTSAKRVHRSRFRDNFVVICGCQNVRFDVRWVGDGYYPYLMEKQMLLKRVQTESGIYIPCPEDHFYSLLYHAVLQKRVLSEEYKEQLQKIYSINHGISIDLDEKGAIMLLKNYLRDIGGAVTIPRDTAVYMNWQNIRKLRQEIHIPRLSRRLALKLTDKIIRIGKGMHYYYLCWLTKKGFRRLQIEQYLEAGTYYVIIQRRRLLVKKNVPKSSLQLICGEAKYAVAPKLRVKRHEETESEQKNQVVMITADGYRLFDFKRGTTLKMFNSPEEHALILKCKQSFSSFFQTTIIKVTDTYCLEKIQRNKPRRTWNNIDLIGNYFKLFERYTNYLHYMSEKDMISIRPIDNDVLSIPDLPKDSTLFFESLLCNIRIPHCVKFVFCHCDMHFENVLFKGDELYVIDFSMAREEVFFYDFFNTIYVEYTDWNNHVLLDLYLSDNQQMKECFEDAFGAVGEVFDPEMKLDYFELFLLTRLRYTIMKIEKNTRGNDRTAKIMSNLYKIRTIFEYAQSKSYRE